MTAPDLDALISRLKGMAADWPFDDYTNAADLADAAWAALVRLREENARLTKEYEAVCNEVFGSQCATIPDAFLEIGKLKLAHNKQYQRAERAEAEVARIKSEVEFLHKRRGEIVIDRDRYRAALGKYPEGRDVMLGGALAEVERSRKRIAALEAERDALKQDAERLQAMAAEWNQNRRGVRYVGMPIWDALCEAIGNDVDGVGMRAAIDAARSKP